MRSPRELEAANRALSEVAARHARAERELHEARTRLEALLEHGEAILWIARPDGAVEHETPLALRRWGAPLKFPADTLEDWLARIHADDRGRVEVAFRHELPVAGFDETYRLRGTDGQWRWVHERAAMARPAGGGAQRVIGVSRDVTPERAAAQALARAGTHDALTGVANRATFERALAAAPADSTLAYVDLDHLALRNEQHGYAAGDAALRHAAAVLAEAAGPAGQVARIAGGGFAVLLAPAAPAQDLIAAALARLEAQPLREAGGRIEATAVLARRGPGAAPGELLARLERACGAAKREGRGRVHAYGDLEQAMDSTAQHAAALRGAIVEGRVALAWQPIAGPQDEGARFEVLARLITRDGRTLTPGAFLEAARDADLLPALDREVVRLAARALAASPQRLAGTAGCHINLALRSAADPRTQDAIARTLASAGIPGAKLCFELSEAELVGAPALAARAVQWAQELGASIAIEHCAVGPAALAVLRSLPITYIKVDLAGTHDLLADPVQRTFAAHALELSRLLRAQLIAVGLETDAVLRGARELGIAYCQGLALGPPRLLEPAADGPAPWD